MNPLRAAFLGISKMPPALMLLIIIGLAVLVTMMVTGEMAQDAEADGAAYSSDGARSPVIESTTTIPQGSTITKVMLKQHRVDEKNIWQDAITTMPTAVGRVAKHTIPARNQIRESDLN